VRVRGERVEGSEEERERGEREKGEHEGEMNSTRRRGGRTSESPNS
jgi:hypothetical protein